MDTLKLLTEHNRRQYEVSRKAEFWVSKISGKRYRYYSRTTNMHRGRKRFSNISNMIMDNGERVYPLPVSEYPYTIEYSKTPYDDKTSYLIRTKILNFKEFKAKIPVFLQKKIAGDIYRDMCDMEMESFTAEQIKLNITERNKFLSVFLNPNKLSIE